MNCTGGRTELVHSGTGITIAIRVANSYRDEGKGEYEPADNEVHPVIDCPLTQHQLSVIQEVSDT